MRALIEGNRRSQEALFELADAVVVLSQWAADALVAAGAPAAKVVVNRLGIAARAGGWRRKPGPSGQPARAPITAGFVGRAESIKGLEDAVRAVTSLPPATGVRLRAVVVTKGPAEVAVLDRCRRLARGDSRVEFVPALHPRDVPGFLSEVDVLLCPSRALEGGPTVALEAMAVGTPVVGSAIPALTEIVTAGRTGWLHAPGDWRGLAAILADLAAAPSEIDRRREALPAARTMNDVCGDYEALYRR